MPYGRDISKCLVSTSISECPMIDTFLSALSARNISECRPPALNSTFCLPLYRLTVGKSISTSYPCAPCHRLPISHLFTRSPDTHPPNYPLHGEKGSDMKSRKLKLRKSRDSVWITDCTAGLTGLLSRDYRRMEVRIPRPSGVATCILAQFGLGRWSDATSWLFTGCCRGCAVFRRVTQVEIPTTYLSRTNTATAAIVTASFWP